MTKQDSREDTNRTTEIIHSPITGTATGLEMAPDDAFAQMMLGKGAAVIPQEPMIYAPEDGSVDLVFDTMHAVGMKTKDGTGLLIHCGVDMTRLEGKGFEALVTQGQEVKAGDPLLKLDLDYIHSKGCKIGASVVDMDLGDNQSIRLLHSGPIRAGEPLFAIDTLTEQATD